MDSSAVTLLIVDDEPINISILMDLLKDRYRLIAARNGAQALSRARGEIRPDLILLDVMMPEMDGHEVCRQLKHDPNTRDIPIIFVTAMSEENDEALGLELGAVDYITKPISPAILYARIRTQLELRRAYSELADQNLHLDRLVKERTADLVTTQDITILALASLAETRDNETGNHIPVPSIMSASWLPSCARRHRSTPFWMIVTIELLYKSAPLHDIGKVGIPDHILLKTDKLDSDEFAIMKRHPKYGRDAIISAEVLIGDQQTSFLRYAREIAYSHHEKWDGSGYPEGLAGDAIPVSGRLMAVADVYDALISRRVYKPAFSHEKAIEIILEGRNRHFDPRIVDAFLEISEQFRLIAGQFKDAEGNAEDVLL